MKRISFRNWMIVWNEETQVFDLYTPEEMEQPKGFRYSEAEASTIEEAKEFIRNY